MMLAMLLWHYELTTPLGVMWAALDERGRVCQLRFGSLDPRATMPLAPKRLLESCRFLARQMDSYFEGTLRTFTVPLNPEGSEFQLRVWDELGAVPYGRTLELAQLVRRLGGEAHRDEVEEALSATPIEILLPAHRVVAGGGSWAGYAPGSAIQKALLTHESGPLLSL